MNNVPAPASGHTLDEYDTERFWRRVNLHGGTAHLADPLSTAVGECWQWTGAINSKGYGWFRLAGRVVKPHRVAYEDCGESNPDRLNLDHLCRNHACVRPTHLQPVTQKTNTNRGLAAFANRTHCRNGHELTDEVVGRRRGSAGTMINYCKACTRDSRARNRAAANSRPVS